MSENELPIAREVRDIIEPLGNGTSGKKRGRPSKAPKIEVAEKATPQPEEPVKKKRGRQKGVKYQRKAKAAATVTEFDPTNLPNPEFLPIGYLIKCGQQLKVIQKQIAELDD